MNGKLVSVFTILLLLLANNAFASDKKDTLSAKVDTLFMHYNDTPSPGIAVLVVQDGKVLLQKGYGLANLEYNIPITPSTVFDVASLSKQFTGMAISMLTEQGKISPNDNIRKYIPEIPDFGYTITISHLVHHTSGLRDWVSTLSLAGWDLESVISFKQIINMVINQQELNFTPGSEYSYSNTGYNVLAELVQRVTGKSFRKWTDENIFTPLGMMNTHFYDDYSELTTNKAYSYYKLNEKYHTVNNGTTAVGSSSLSTTIEDMAKWVINLDKPEVVTPSIVNRMFEQGKLNNDSLISYAYGLNVSEYRGVKKVTHSGSWASYTSFLCYFPEQHLSIVVLQNHSGNTYKAAHDIADIYLPKTVEPKPATGSTQTPQFIAIPISLAKQYMGKYKLGEGWYVTISQGENSLEIRSTGETPVPFNATSDSTFWAYNSPFSFYKNNSEEVERLYFRGMTCPKVTTTNNTWSELVGNYYSEELHTTYKVVIEDGKLVAKHFINGTINLTPTYKEEFEGSEWYMGYVIFYRDSNGMVEGFLVNTNKSRNQRFIKR